MKRVLFKGVPLASATVSVAVPKPWRLSVSADPSWGVKIFVDGRDNGGLSLEDAEKLSMAFASAVTIAEEMEIIDDELPGLLTRVGLVMADGGMADAHLQDTFDEAVHELASKEASALNNMGVDEQCEYLVRELGAAEVSRMIADAEEKLGRETPFGSPAETERLDALDRGLSDPD